MRTQFMPTLVGAFVLIGFILMIAFVIYRFEEVQLQEADTYALYFEGSMEGLEVGSEVTFRGIKVGEVVNIGLEINPKTEKLEIPVYVQLLEFKKDPDMPKIKDYLVEAIQEGLRAQLYSVSLLTGTVGVRLVFKPDVPSYLIPPNGKKNIIIPTIKGADRDIDVQATLDKAEKTLETIRETVDKNSPKLSTFLDNMSNASYDVKTFLKNLEGQVAPATKAFTQSFYDIGEAAKSVRQLSNHLERHPESIITGKR